MSFPGVSENRRGSGPPSIRLAECMKEGEQTGVVLLKRTHAHSEDNWQGFLPMYDEEDSVLSFLATQWCRPNSSVGVFRARYHSWEQDTRGREISVFVGTPVMQLGP